MDPTATTDPRADELARLARERAVRKRLQDLASAFSRGVSATLTIGPALDAVAREANVLFGTERVSVWLHQRRTRELVLSGSSEAASLDSARDGSLDSARDRSTVPPRVSTEDAIAPAARGLRLEGPLVLAEPRETLVAPLRGWRRALGTLVIDGVSATLDAGQLAELAQELSRQLAVGVENIQLLEEVLRQRRLLENTFNSILDLVVVTDNQLRVVQMNGSFAARVRATRRELLERPLTELIGAEMAEWVRAHDPGETARAARITDHTLGGIFACTVTPLINEDGERVGHVLVARDISAQARLEAEQEALRARLAQSQRLASLGQFVAGIAHEMNNPLQGVLGHLELLMETSEHAKPLRKDLRRIYLEGERAAKIVRNLLVFTGSHRMARQRIRVERVIARALASRRVALASQAIEVARETATVPPIQGDGLLLQQAFLNVLINAEHAVAGVPQPRIEVAIALAESESVVRTTVRDNGSGLAPEVLPRIFDPFFTTKDVGQGTGLGLAITYGIIQEHGGSITAANAPEGGAIVTIDLPVAADSARSARTRC